MWWDENLFLITIRQLEQLPDGTALIAIDGELVYKGVNDIDLDTRAGFLAYGFTKEIVPRKYKVYFDVKNI